MRTTPLEDWISRKISEGGQHLTRKSIEEYQLLKLQETIKLARTRSIFYRRHLSDLPLESISRLEEFVHYPFTTAQEVRENALQLLCVSQGDINRVVTLESSGTTGQPKRLYFTREDQELTVDFFGVGMSTLVDPGDRVLILLPGEKPGSVGDLLATALERRRAIPIPHGLVRSVSETLAVMARERVDCLVGIPTQVLALARSGRAAKGYGPIRLKSALLSTDHVPEAIRSGLERLWGCAVYGHYGMTEMGLGGGVECEARSGYHLREADLLFEIINPSTGLPVPEGEPGEVIFTTLTRRGMPLIRYRTGDISRLINAPCPCGTVLKRLERVRRRIDGCVSFERGNTLTMADLDEALFPLEGILDFTAALAHSDRVDCLQIDALVIPGIDQRLIATIQTALDSIDTIRAMKERGRLEALVSIQSEGDGIWQGSGKRVITERGWSLSETRVKS